IICVNEMIFFNTYKKFLMDQHQDKKTVEFEKMIDYIVLCDGRDLNKQGHGIVFDKIGYPGVKKLAAGLQHTIDDLIKKSYDKKRKIYPMQSHAIPGNPRKNTLNHNDQTIQ